MHGVIESWDNGWYGISLGLSGDEIDRLISLLSKLRNAPEQHFHISSDYAGAGGLGDIEFYVDEAGSASNLQLGGLALASGRKLPSTGA